MAEFTHFKCQKVKNLEFKLQPPDSIAFVAYTYTKSVYIFY